MSVKVSVIIATRNRAHYLRKALRSLADQTLSPDLFEILVVDNGSQDETKAVVDEFSAAYHLHYIYEPVAGCSRARNDGMRNSQGTYIAFLDDDAVASPEWLDLYLGAFQTFGPEVGLIGGRVEIIWEAPKPEWLLEERLSILSVYRFGDSPVELDNTQVLSICNLAVPRCVLEEVGGLREDLGKTGSLPLAHAEWALKQEIDAKGYRSIYHPDIVVHHHMPASRLTKSWFRERAYWSAVSEAVMANPDGQLPAATRTKMAASKLGWMLPRLLVWPVTLDPGYRFKRECQVRESMGYVAGLFKKSVPSTP